MLVRVIKRARERETPTYDMLMREGGGMCVHVVDIFTTMLMFRYTG